jgi:hypothetical protein
MVRTAKSTALPSTRARPSMRKARPRRAVLLVATRKGAWLLHGDASRRRAAGGHAQGRLASAR